MKYGITDIAKILGMTTSAIHYFEKQNLIKIGKEYNGHRYFNVVDVFRLLSYKKYRSMGFSLKTLVKQFSGNENDRQVIQERIAKQKQDAMKKAEYYRNLADSIDAHLQSINHIDALLDDYEFAISPTMMILHDEECGWVSKNRKAQKVVEKWVKAMPATRLSIVLNTKDVSKAFFGYSATPEKVREFTLPMDLNVKEMPAVSCLHTIVAVDDKFTENPNLVFEKPLQYAAKRGFEICGTCWGHILLVEVSQGAQLKSYVELWLPIR